MSDRFRPEWVIDFTGMRSPGDPTPTLLPNGVVVSTVPPTLPRAPGRLPAQPGELPGDGGEAPAVHLPEARDLHRVVPSAPGTVLDSGGPGTANRIWICPSGSYTRRPRCTRAAPPHSRSAPALSPSAQTLTPAARADPRHPGPMTCIKDESTTSDPGSTCSSSCPLCATEFARHGPSSSPRPHGRPLQRPARRPNAHHHAQRDPPAPHRRSPTLHPGHANRLTVPLLFFPRPTPYRRAPNCGRY